MIILTVQQVVEKLREEKQNNLPSRYPCRAIMVKNVAEYCCLLNELQTINDVSIVNSSQLFSSYDVLPKYENLKKAEYQDKWIVLTGVSEYLRLFSKKEAHDRRFASLWGYQAPASSLGRIIIPLWGCEAQWFDSALNLSGDIRQQDYYYDCVDADAPEQSMDLLILSGVFENCLTQLRGMHRYVCVGLEEWFAYWEHPSPENAQFILLTKRCRNIATVAGKISVHVMEDILLFMKANMQGADILSKDNCPDDAQLLLFNSVLKGISLDEAILQNLNLSTFSGIDVMSKWDHLTDAQKNLVVLWFEAHPDESYLRNCFSVAKSIVDVPYHIKHDVLKLYMDKPEWVSEYKSLSLVMTLKSDSDFFEALNRIPEYDTRLDFVTSRTREERIYLLRMVGEWLRKDSVQAQTSSKLKEVYPELMSYLECTSPSMEQADINAYMAAYKMYKLSNTLPDDEDVYFNGIQTSRFESRYSVLSDYVDADTEIIWIDALGIEWLPLLHSSIGAKCDGVVKSIHITQASLPSETCYNEQWKKMDTPYKKYDKLDKLAHKGVVDEPDYYACIEEQFAFVTNISNYVEESMKKHHRIIITGDHGTSRLAARMFHEKEGLAVPANATVGSHGRYCKLPPDNAISAANMIIKKGDDIQYVVFANYDHFKQSGFAAGGDDDNAIFGEVHGGASPEEVLVPVIVVDSNKEIPLLAKWKKSTVKICMRKAKFEITFNKPVNTLITEIGDKQGEVSSVGDGTIWTITFANIKAGQYNLKVIADNCIVELPKVTINSALSGGEGDLP